MFENIFNVLFSKQEAKGLSGKWPQYFGSEQEKYALVYDKSIITITETSICWDFLYPGTTVALYECWPINQTTV